MERQPREHPTDTSPDKDQNADIRVMIVDDSLTVRTVFSRMVSDVEGLELAGTFSNAERALAKLDEVAPNVVLLDLEMPGMGGLEALPKILEKNNHAEVLVVSSLTEDGAEHTLAALSMGAADTMLKPRPGEFDDEYRAALISKIRALGGDDRGTIPHSPVPVAREPQRPRFTNRSFAPEMVAIGASTGGIHALNILVRNLPRTFDLPILVTQHLPSSFMPVFARQLEVASARRTTVAEPGLEIRRGEIVIAPGDGHLQVNREGDRFYCEITRKTASSGCMPSVDFMLESLAANLDGRALAVILSGMGRDGTEGAAALAEKGGKIFVQDAESSAVWGMPGSIAKAGLADKVETPESLVDAIVASCGVPAWR